MPTICGLRRRGYSPQAIHNFIDKIGYTKFEAQNDIGLLEHAVRENLKQNSHSRQCSYQSGKTYCNKLFRKDWLK